MPVNAYQEKSQKRKILIIIGQINPSCGYQSTSFPATSVLTQWVYGQNGNDNSSGRHA